MKLINPSKSPGLPRARRKISGWNSRCSRLRLHRTKLGRQHGFLQVDLMIGLAILTLAIMPLGFAFLHERQVLKMEYARSVANEIVDGEMEILAAGAGRSLPDGSQNYLIHANAAACLPPGHFQLTKTGNHLRLEWLPDARRGVSTVVREVTIK